MNEEDKKPGTANGDLCECGEAQLPQWTGNETARACQACGLVDERSKPDENQNPT